MTFKEASKKFKYFKRSSWEEEDYLFYRNGTLFDDGGNVHNLSSEEMSKEDWVEMKKPRSILIEDDSMEDELDCPDCGDKFPRKEMVRSRFERCVFVCANCDESSDQDDR